MMACNNRYEKEFFIENLSIPRVDTVIFKIAPNQNVFKRIISVEGSSNGKLVIDRYELLSGKIDTVFSSDWYASDYILRYTPVDATEGCLIVRLELLAL